VPPCRQGRDKNDGRTGGCWWCWSWCNSTKVLYNMVGGISLRTKPAINSRNNLVTSKHMRSVIGDLVCLVLGRTWSHARTWNAWAVVLFLVSSGEPCHVQEPERTFSRARRNWKTSALIFQNFYELLHTCPLPESYEFLRSCPRLESWILVHLSPSFRIIRTGRCISFEFSLWTFLIFLSF
jgi:hypothetical protein